jgi:hypothetical protein
MKTKLPSFVLFVCFGVFSADQANAAGGKKKAAAQARAAAKSESETPAKALEIYILHLDQLLALSPQGGGPTPLRNQTPGRLVVLKQRFTAERASSQGKEAANLDAAIATCDALIGATNERQRAASELRASTAVKGSEKINAPGRKETLNQGVRGGDLAKAVGEIQEGKRERAEKRAGHRETQKDDGAMDAMAVKHWHERSQQLEKQINAAYARIQS